MVSNLPVSTWAGSNSWVISGSKTKSGKVIFANDAHMAYSQPSVWFEAHLEGPGFSFYGNHLAGVPFARIGHNRFAAWGLTMLENDDVDFYKERINPENPNQVWFVDHGEDLTIRRETINVKGQKDVVFEVRTSRQGPILNEVDHRVAQTGSDPVAVRWAFNKFPTTVAEAFYGLSHARSIDEARQAAWWDSVHTNALKKSRQMIFARSFDRAIRQLTGRLARTSPPGNGPWSTRSSTATPLGRQKPLNAFFNVGPFAAMGGNEPLVNIEF